MAFFFPRKTHDPRVKPPQWGPIGDVRDAVRRNAEAMGIDPACLVGVFPHWAMAGSTSYNIMGYLNGSINSANWTKNWLNFDGSNDYVDCGVNDLWEIANDGGTEVHCSIVSVGAIDNLNDHRVFVSKWDGSNYEWYFDVSDTNELELFLYSDKQDGGERLEIKSTVSNILDKNKVYGVSYYGDAATGDLFLDGNDLNASVTNNNYSSLVRANAPMLIGALDPGGVDRLYKGDISLTVLVKGQALTAEQHAFLGENPYFLLMPRPRPIIVDLAGGTTTTVNSDLTSLFDVRKKVRSQVTSVFDVLTTVQSKITSVFDVLNTVQSDLQAVYDVQTLVQSDVQAVYDVNGRVQSDLTAAFDIAKKVQSDIAFVFSVLTTVQSDTQLLYDVLDLVQSDIQAVYDIRAKIQSDIEVVYDMSGRVQSDLTLLYDIEAKTGFLLSIVHDVLQDITDDLAK